MMIEKNKIYNCDCIEGMNSMPEGSVDIIVTSPPYNIGKAYTSYKDNIPRNNYLDWLSEVAKASFRVLSDDGSLYLNVGGNLKDPWISIDAAQKFRENGFVLQNLIHWIKSIAVDNVCAVGHYKPVKSNRFHNDCHEFIFHFTKTGNVKIERLATGVPYRYKSNIKRWGNSQHEDLRDRGNTWFIPYETVRESRPHPAAFPVKLPEMCIRDHGISRCGLVLDPFMGIGNTAVAAINLGVSFVGFDIDENYCRIAEERIIEVQK